MGIGVGVKQPNGNIDALDLFDVVFVLEDLGQQDLTFVVVLQRGHGGLLVHFEGDHQIRPEGSGELTGHDYGIAAEGAFGGTGGFVCYDFAAAGVAAVDPQTVRLTFLPRIRVGFPDHIVLILLIQLRLIGHQGFNLEFGVAVGAFHLLLAAAEFNATVAMGAFEFL